jgi:UDP-N-acetylmuramoyl-L-alanyl-D-glutamate--2,6-diaminopimelate ligase
MMEGGANMPTGLITTRHSYVGEKLLPPPRWPNWEIQLSQLLQQMAEGGCQRGIIVLTPPMLAAGMLEGFPLELAVVTSLQDSTEAEQVCDWLAPRCPVLVCSVDDADGRHLAQRWRGRKLTYAEKRGEADVNGRNLRLLRDRIEFEALTNQGIARVRLPVPGGFGLYHSLAALAVGQYWGISLQKMVSLLGHAGGVPGRMELHELKGGIAALIDSASTPEQLENLLLTTREMVTGRLLLVCGAPGDRDRSSRRQIGEVISRMADRIYLTADDPRTEPVADICRDIRQGMHGRKGTVIPDRERAIRRAIAGAEPGDLVILAGRGDRSTMLAEKRIIPFDERKILEKFQ